MPKVVKPLSDTQIRQAKPKLKEYNLSDGQGLYLRVKPNGTKVWIFNFTRPIRKSRANMTLGRYPALTLADARKYRSEALSLLAKGIDPAEDKKKQECNHESTLLAISQQWFEVKKASVTADYAHDIWRSLEQHIFPSLGNIPIDEIRPKMIIDALKPVAARGHLETVKRVCQRINEVMVFAVNIGVVEANYLSGVKSAFRPPKAKHMPTIKPQELGSFLADLHNACIRQVTRLVILWQLHTMCRPGEAAGTRWDEIDLETKIWTIPPERMKRKRPHIIPLSDSAIKVLDAAKKLSDGSPFVFPSDRKRNSPINPQTANMALKRMGYTNRLVAHGLRSIASTVLNEQGFDYDVIESALSHIDSNSVRNAYNRAQYLDRRKKMMDWWSEYINNSLPYA